MSKTHYTIFTDPGHGWLQVSIFEASKLDILDQISAFSYMDNNYLYLEEDADMSVFLRAKFQLPVNSEYTEPQKATVKQFFLECHDSYSNHSPVRRKQDYCAEAARRNL